MQTLTVVLLIEMAVVLCSGGLVRDPTEPHSLFKRQTAELGGDPKELHSLLKRETAELGGDPKELHSLLKRETAELGGGHKEPHSLLKRHINCPPMAICLPATQPPPIKALSGSRQKRGSKPVPIIACNRTTGKCRRI